MDSSGGRRDAIVMYPCPPGYCGCVAITEGNSVQCRPVFNSLAPDLQCSCDRYGMPNPDTNGVEESVLYSEVSSFLNACKSDTWCGKGVLFREMYHFSNRGVPPYYTSMTVLLDPKC